MTPIRVLFAYWGNLARSIMAEAILRQFGGPAFEVSSAGIVNPLFIPAALAARAATPGRPNV
jgi:protein-tyrosine-phosphatase